MEDGLGRFILFLFGGFLIVGLLFVIKPPPCTHRGIAKEFVQAVGHRNYTTYIYRTNENVLFETDHLYASGEAICEY